MATTAAETRSPVTKPPENPRRGVAFTSTSGGAPSCAAPANGRATTDGGSSGPIAAKGSTTGKVTDSGVTTAAPFDPFFPFDPFVPETMAFSLTQRRICSRDSEGRTVNFSPPPFSLPSVHANSPSASMRWLRSENLTGMVPFLRTGATVRKPRPPSETSTTLPPLLFPRLKYAKPCTFVLGFWRRSGPVIGSTTEQKR